eukprot:SAG31_NODE_82_length_27046_cov_45.857275_5_plen_270_part_00
MLLSRFCGTFPVFMGLIEKYGTNRESVTLQARNPFYHSDRYSVEPPAQATKPASDPQKYYPNLDQTVQTNPKAIELAERLPLFGVPKNIKRSKRYTQKVGEDSDFVPQEVPRDSQKALFEWPEYPNQGRRFTDVIRHFETGVYKKEIDASDPNDEAPLYSSFTRDNVFPTLKHGRRSTKGGSFSSTRKSFGQNVASVGVDNAAGSAGGGFNLAAAQDIGQRGASPQSIAAARNTYLKSPELRVSLGGTGKFKEQSLGVRTGALQMMLSR